MDTLHRYVAYFKWLFIVVLQIYVFTKNGIFNINITRILFS